MVQRPTRFIPALLVLFASCAKDGGTPAYVRLATPIVLASNGTDTISSKITDLWVYANDEPVGVWQPDRRIPVLASGSTTIKLIAGVRNNGITDNRIQYPNYQTFQQQVDLVPLAETLIRPTFKYYENLTYWSEDFEGTGNNFDVIGDTTLNQTDTSCPSCVFQGQHSNAFFLDTQHSFIRCINSNTLGNFPNSIAIGFLEIDYRSDIRFLVGITYLSNGSTQTTPYVYVSPTGSGGTMPWNHVYIDLGSAWNLAAGSQNHFYIEGLLGSGESSGQVYLDNVKVIYR